jgi:hypothetical protein
MGRIFEKYKADRIDFQDFDQDWRILGLAGFLGYPIRSAKTFQPAVFDQDFADFMIYRIDLTVYPIKSAKTFSASALCILGPNWDTIRDEAKEASLPASA